MFENPRFGDDVVRFCVGLAGHFVEFAQTFGPFFEILDRDTGLLFDGSEEAFVELFGLDLQLVGDDQ